MDARTRAWLDQEDATMTATIRRHGWAIQYIGGEGCCAPGCCGGDGPVLPPFAYTIGLSGLDHPELLVFGLPEETTAMVLNTLGERVRNGTDLLPGEMVTFPDWPHRIVPEPVPNPGEIVFSANRYYRRPPESPVPVLQLSYDDPAGRFPWEDDYIAPEMQPRPGTFQA